MASITAEPHLQGHPRSRSIRRPTLGLRARATLAFGLTALVLSLVLSTVAYGLVRSYLVDERESTSRRQTYANARLVRSVLRAPDPDLPALLESLRGATGSETLLRFKGRWYSTSVSAGPENVPAGLQEVVAAGGAALQKFRADRGAELAVGVHIAGVEASYFELFELGDLSNTLDVLATSLAIAAVVATAAGAILGRTASARIVSPVREMADVARGITEGNLDARLNAEGDRDLEPLVVAFNEMVDSLSERIAVESRFASDVSHEVRAPLAALSSAVEVVRRRQAELPEAVLVAVAALEAQVQAFNTLVLELLEIARFDADTAQLERTDVDLQALAVVVLDSFGLVPDLVEVEPGARVVLPADERRVERILANLVENALHYAGGPRRVAIQAGDGVTLVAVEDHGPGVPEEDRDRIFDRFARGEAGQAPEAPKGTGLGLALVAEHARLHGGRAWVEARVGGGARFVVALPHEA
jgi:signal transduction histidine kinase